MTKFCEITLIIDEQPNFYRKMRLLLSFCELFSAIFYSVKVVITKIEVHNLKAKKNNNWKKFWAIFNSGIRDWMEFSVNQNCFLMFIFVVNCLPDCSAQIHTRVSSSHENRAPKNNNFREGFGWWRMFELQISMFSMFYWSRSWSK